MRARPTPSWNHLAVGAMVVGTALRLRQFAVDRSLWLDEALLAKNLISRDYAGLLEPLGGQQGAPVGYLWTVRSLVVALGPDEMWMRLPSLVAGVALLPLVWLLGRRLLSERAAAVAVALAAVSPGLIRYSTELKQYALDATVAVGLVLLAARAVDDRTGRRLGALTAAGVVAVWFSHPAVFVLAGVGLVLAVRPLRDRDGRGVAVLAAVGGAWAASLGALYRVSLRDLAGNDFLTEYWRAGFPADPQRPDRLLGWVWTASVDLLDDIGGFGPAVVAVVTTVAVLAGAAALVARGRGRAVALLLAFLPALVLAAGLELYPFRGRLALFVLPFALLLLAGVLDLPSVRWRQAGQAGTDQASAGESGDDRATNRSTGRSSPRILSFGATALVAAVAVAPLATTAEEAVDPTPFPESRPVIEHVAAAREPGEDIYLHGLAKPPFQVYGHRHGLSASGRTRWVRPDRCDQTPPPFAGEDGRAWVIFAYTHSAYPDDEARILRTHLDTLGRRVELVEAHDAFAALYDFGATPTDPTGEDQLVTATTGCLRVDDP